MIDPPIATARKIMSRCIIHIGMHRTGSTSIQHSLHGFGDNRFLYARLGDDPNHSLAMYSLFAHQPEQHHLHGRNGADAAAVLDYIATMRADLEEAVSASQGRTLVISGEDINAIPLNGLLKLRDYFQQRFEDVTVVGYIRPPGGHMSSVFQHRIRIGSVDGFNLEPRYRSYKRTFGKFYKVFGRERVNLWKFDIAAFRGGCAVQDFCSRLDIALPPERIVRLNEALPRQVVALLYTYRKVAPAGAATMTGQQRQGLLDRLATIGSDPFRLSPEIIRPILEKNRADIGWMEARLDQTLDEDLGGHRPGDVRDEPDLLRPDPMVTGKLLALLGDAAPRGVKGETPEEVAQLVHALRETRREGSRSPGTIDTYFGNKVTALREYLLRHMTMGTVGTKRKS
jgi:hypothetical protein